MASVPFDTLDFTRRLKAGGFSAEQAEAMADALAAVPMANAAGKRDLAELELRTDNQFVAVRRDIADLDAKVDARLRDLENRLVIKLGAMMAGVAALLFAALSVTA
jgi:hypothetical protein